MEKLFSLLVAASFSVTGVLPVSATPAERAIDRESSLVIEREVVSEDVYAMYRHVVADNSNNDKVVMAYYDHLEELVLREAKHNPNFSAELVLQSVTYAAEKHNGQMRKFSDTPYIMHPIAVTTILFEEGGVRDHYVLAAAALHDTLEDTDAIPKEVEHLFSYHVCSLVLELTNPEGLTKETKHAWQIEHIKNLSPDAKLIKIADRTHNLRSFNSEKFEKQSPEALNKKKYFTASRELGKRLSGQNKDLDAKLQAELDYYSSNR